VKAGYHSFQASEKNLAVHLAVNSFLYLIIILSCPHEHWSSWWFRYIKIQVRISRRKLEGDSTLIESWRATYIYLSIWQWRRRRREVKIRYFFNYFFLVWRWCPSQLACTTTNPTGPEVNDHVSLQWPSYKQLQGSNLRPQREQISWSQAFNY